MTTGAMIDAVIIGGGQSGLAAARALQRARFEPLVLEAGQGPAGSWPRFYDSLLAFTPARYSTLPGLPFGGDPDRYPHRDEIVDYLHRYTATLDVYMRTGQRAVSVTADGPGFAVHLADGEVIPARCVVSATGEFGRPFRPRLPGLDRFPGTVIHAAEYRNPLPFAGQRVIVVGSRSTAVQIAAELAAHSDVTLACRTSVRFAPHRHLGRDLHFWLKVTGLDRSLVFGRWLRRHPPAPPVLDDGDLRAALPACRPMFAEIRDDIVHWPDGAREPVDAIILATGYRPAVDHLRDLGALDETGRPLHLCGLSTTHPGLGYVGLPQQRTLSSATLRGVGRDAEYVAAQLVRHRPPIRAVSDRSSGRGR